MVWAADRVARRRLHARLGARTHAVAAELSWPHRRARRALATAAMTCAALALMQPRWGEGDEVEQRGVDIVACLDLSRSMLARDLPPNRLACAQRELTALAERARRDRLGLVVFAGEARMHVPLTQDVDSFATLVDQAHTLGGLRSGTDLGAAIDAARTALVGPPGGHETILLLTDGEDHGGSGLRAAQACRQAGVTVHCVGFGSQHGSKIAVGTPGGESWLRDASGEEVVSAMDPTSLRAIAEATGGDFVAATAAPVALVDLYDRRVQSMARKALATARLDARSNRFQGPLGLAVLLWLLELAISDRARSRRARIVIS
jgi:Ca-activated chloride channel family protein